MKTWIPISERLPKLEKDENGFYNSIPVVAWDGERRIPCYYDMIQKEHSILFDSNAEDEEVFRTDEGLKIQNVTHWMEIPEGPKE